MDKDEQRLLAELRHVADQGPEPPHLNERIDVLSQMIEIYPPKMHSYGALEAVALFMLVVGVLLLGLAAVAMVFALAPSPSLKFDWGGQVSLFIVSGVSGLIGFMWVVSSQWLQLAIDAQGNLDRHSFALHGIFHVLLAQRKDAANEHT